MINQKFKEMVAVILFIAGKGGAEAVRSSEIAAEFGVHPRHFEQILQKLVHDGILKGSKGPKGGYTLAREKRRISLFDIYEVFRSMEKKPHIGFNLVSAVLLDIENDIEKKIQYITLDSVCDISNGGEGEFAI